jgi:hypothetical protein
MKLAVLIVAALLSATVLIAQEEKKRYSSSEIQTFLDQKASSNGIYGAFHIGYSQIAGRDAMNMGFRGGWIANHKFALGFAGTGFFSDKRSTSTSGLDNYIAGGYGGILFEPIAMPMSQVHVSFPMIIGAGGVTIIERYQHMSDWTYYDPTSSKAEPFFVFEPGAELEFNIAKFFRFGLGVSYRFTSNVDLAGISPDALRGLNGHVIFKFGKF